MFKIQIIKMNGERLLEIKPGQGIHYIARTKYHICLEQWV